MACGIPVIATDCPMGGSAILIKDGDNGVLIPVGDREKLIQALNRMVLDNEFYKQVSNNSVRIIDELRVDKIADKWLE